MPTSKNTPRFTVLSIDGVPTGLLHRLTSQGHMPNLARLAEKNPIRPMRSVQPTVSCVAWATYMTGKNPGKHGIYGFIDRRDHSYDLTFPNADTLAADNLWQILSHAGRRVFGMNVPTTYPPRAVNGILIGCFLAPSLNDKACYPPGIADFLRSIDYRIDSDPMLARKDKLAMLDDLNRTLDARTRALFHFLDAEPWDFFHTHIMASDRINHFLWQKMLQDDPVFAPAFFAFYRRIDQAVGALLDRLPDDSPLLIFSDHGFCPIKYEVQLSRYLVETGWTTPLEKVQHPLSIDPHRSRAYCLIPGRIYINLRRREPHGLVPLEEYQQTRLQLRDDLLKLRDPRTHDPVIQTVLTREQLYWPRGTHPPCSLTPEQVALHEGTYGKAPDLIAIPHDGYDLKLGLAGAELFQTTQLEGMHTFHDAFMIARNVPALPTENLEIMRIAPAILNTLGVDVPADMDPQGTCRPPRGGVD